MPIVQGHLNDLAKRSLPLYFTYEIGTIYGGNIVNAGAINKLELCHFSKCWILHFEVY
jgi:hypothetical protein